MFNFLKKKKKKTLCIRATDVLDIIREDYENGDIFGLVEFKYNDKIYRMGSDIPSETEYLKYLENSSDKETIKENIQFVFDDKNYGTIEDMVNNTKIDGYKLSQLPMPIEILKAGILCGTVMLDDPYGDRRLSQYAIDCECYKDE